MTPTMLPGSAAISKAAVLPPCAEHMLSRGLPVRRRGHGGIHSWRRRSRRCGAWEGRVPFRRRGLSGCGAGWLRPERSRQRQARQRRFPGDRRRFRRRREARRGCTRTAGEGSRGQGLHGCGSSWSVVQMGGFYHGTEGSEHSEDRKVLFGVPVTPDWYEFTLILDCPLGCVDAMVNCSLLSEPVAEPLQTPLHDELLITPHERRCVNFVHLLPPDRGPSCHDMRSRKCRGEIPPPIRNVVP